MQDANELEKKMCLRIASDIVKSLIDGMPSIRESLQTGRQASFTATVSFKTHATKETEELLAKVNTRTRTPGDEYEHKLALHNGQLSLFEGAPAEQAGDPEDGGALESFDAD